MTLPILTSAAVPLFFQLLVGSPWPEMPPAQYQHPYHGHLSVHRGTDAQIHQWCGSYMVRACAMPRGSSCSIYLPSTGDPQILAALRVHEIGHCNGWRHR